MELTVTPNTMDFGDETAKELSKFKVYHEEDGTMIMPRYYATPLFGVPKETTHVPIEIPIIFSAALRDYQIDIVNKCVTHMKEQGGGLLSVPCGRGKTVMALKIASVLSVKTLVVVHKSFLQDQWVARANQFIESPKIGVIRQKKVDTEDKQIVIAMIQSLAKRDYGTTLFNEFGLVIYDESHHSPAKVFSQALQKTNTKYTLSLSATPYREDGLIKVMHWFLGPTIYQEKMQLNNQVVAKVLTYTSTNKLFVEKTVWRQSRAFPSCPIMINNLVDILSRDNHIINIIDTLRKDPLRKILILSGRKEHLKYLKERTDALLKQDMQKGILEKNEINTYFYTGDLKQHERQEAEQHADILFATYDMAHEGLDIERLNTIILATPKKNVVQAIGRVLRKVLKDGDIRPLIIDVVDDLSIFVNQGRLREKFYYQSKYIIDHFYIIDKEMVTKKEYMRRVKNTECDDGNNIQPPETYDKLLETPLVQFGVVPVVDDDIQDNNSYNNSYNNNGCMFGKNNNNSNSNSNSNSNNGCMFKKTEKSKPEPEPEPKPDETPKKKKKNKEHELNKT